MSRSSSRHSRAPGGALLSALGLLGAAAFVLAAHGCRCESRAPTTIASPPRSASASTKPTGLAGDVLGLPVEVVRRDPRLIPVGETGTVEVIVKPMRDLEGVRVELTGDKGLEILGRPLAWDVGVLMKDSTFAETVEVRPTREGLLYVKVLVTGLRDGRRLGRSGVVPVLTSEESIRAALETPGRLIVDPSGRRILEIPLDGEGLPSSKAEEPR